MDSNRTDTHIEITGEPTKERFHVEVTQADLMRLADRALAAEQERDDLRAEVNSLRMTLEWIATSGSDAALLSAAAQRALRAPTEPVVTG